MSDRLGGLRETLNKYLKNNFMFLIGLNCRNGDCQVMVLVWGMDQYLVVVVTLIFS